MATSDVRESRAVGAYCYLIFRKVYLLLVILIRLQDRVLAETRLQLVVGWCACGCAHYSKFSLLGSYTVN